MRIGTIGSGPIIDWVLSGVRETENVTCEAVYSRTLEKAKQTADKYQVTRIYTDLDEMLEDKEIDCIYVASPNSLHYEQVKRALTKGRHVICEKPFTSTVEEGNELIALAKEKGLFLFEAITTMYLPNYGMVKDMLSSIGRIRLINCSFCQYSSRYDLLMKGELPNVFNPAFSGGALMDINMYNLYFVMGLFGKPLEAIYYPNRHVCGVDTSGIMILKYPDFICECTAAKDTWGTNAAQIMGEKGYIYVTDPSNECREVKLVTKEKEQLFNEQEGFHQWYFVMKGIAEVFDSGDLKECYRRLDMTKMVLEVMHEARIEAGIKFDADSK